MSLKVSDLCDSEGADSISVISLSGLCDSPCVSPNDKHECQTISCYESLSSWELSDNGEHFCADDGYPKSLLLACYCSQQLDRMIEEKGVYAGIMEMTKSNVCKPYAEGQLTMQFLTFLTGTIITVINTMAENIMKK